MKESISELIKKEAKIEVAKLTEEEIAKGKTYVADLKLESIINIAKGKIEDLNVKNLEKAVKVVLGVANSMNGILVEGKRPKEVIKEIEEGKIKIE